MTDELVVAVAAADPLRRRVAALLDRADIPPSIQAASPEELARACESAAPHVAVVSWAVCERGAADVRRLAGMMSRTRIVVVVPSSDRQTIRAVLQAGASGVVVAGQLALTLAMVVRSVWLGQASVPRE